MAMMQGTIFLRSARQAGLLGNCTSVVLIQQVWTGRHYPRPRTAQPSVISVSGLATRAHPNHTECVQCRQENIFTEDIDAPGVECNALWLNSCFLFSP